MALRPELPGKERRMTDQLRKAFEKAAELPDYDQDELAALLLDAIDSDRKWDTVLAKDPGKLQRMADKAVEHARAGRNLPLDPDKL